MISSTIAQFGNPAEKAAQGMQQRSKVNRLLELTRTQGEFDDRAASMNASPHTGPDYSGYSNEHEYRGGLNRQGEIAGLKSELTGKGPKQVQHTYAGTEFAMGPATRALQQRVEPSETDNLDYFGRLAQVQGLQAQTERQRTAGQREDTEDDPAFAAIRRAIAHDDTVSAGGARGEAESAEYLAPGQNDARRQRLWDDEARRKTLAPYDPAAIRGGATVAAADIRADADRYKADAGVEGRTGSAAINSLGRVAGTMITSPDQAQRVDSAVGAIRPNVPGQQPAPQQGAAGDGTKIFPRGRLAEFARANGFGSEAAASDYVQRVHGYTVR